MLFAHRSTRAHAEKFSRLYLQLDRESGIRRKGVKNETQLRAVSSSRLIRHDNLARRQLQKKSKNGWHVCSVVMENRVGEQAETHHNWWHTLSW